MNLGNLIVIVKVYTHFGSEECIGIYIGYTIYSGVIRCCFHRHGDDLVLCGGVQRECCCYEQREEDGEGWFHRTQVLVEVCPDGDET